MQELLGSEDNENLSIETPSEGRLPNSSRPQEDFLLPRHPHPESVTAIQSSHVLEVHLSLVTYEKIIYMYIRDKQLIRETTVPQRP